MSKVLAFMSGGLDSLASTLIASEYYDIELAHVKLELSNKKGYIQRAIAAYDCVLQQKQLLEEYLDKELILHISKVVIPPQFYGFDIVYTMPIMLQMAKSGGYAGAIRGNTADTTEENRLLGEEYEYYHTVYPQLMKKAYKFDSLLSPAINYTTKELVDLVPGQFHKTILLCNSPVVKEGIIYSCDGTCFKCSREGQKDKIFNKQIPLKFVKKSS